MQSTTGGTARPITLYGDEVLHRPCAPVTTFDQDLATLIDDMFASMYAARGVGLAANQIGVALRVFVYDCPDASGERRGSPLQWRRHRDRHRDTPRRRSHCAGKRRRPHQLHG